MGISVMTPLSPGCLPTPSPRGASLRTFSVCRAPKPEPINADGSQVAGTPCNIIPQALFDPVGKKMIDLYPNASNTFGPLGTNYTNVPVRSLGENEFDIRVDHNFSPKDSMFARFSYDQAT